MGVQMTAEELEQFLANGLTVIFITINPDGTPLPTPLWYVNRGTTIYVSTMRRLRKVKNLLRDPRVTALVEDGEVYLKLRAAILKGQATIVDDEGEIAWFNEQMAVKYEGRRPPMESLPAATQRHYASPGVVIRLVPQKVWTWDNSKLRMGPAP